MPLTDTKTAAQTTEERIKAIITKRPVMLFMKGSPDAVKCGFSRQMIEVLRPYNIVDVRSLLCPRGVANPAY